MWAVATLLVISDGRMDILLKIPDAIYIFELKYGKSADEAIE